MPNKARALLLACHPGPSAVVTVVVLVLGVTLGYEPLRLILLGGAVLTGQLSIGWSNDWIDAKRDIAVHRTDKPVARGDVTPATVRIASFVALAATVVLSAFLGPVAAAAQLTGVAAGWAYNVGLKSTPLSIVPYAVCFGLLPAVATFGQLHPRAPAPWVLAVGALLGIAAHFTNVLPDLDDDRRTGIRGLPHIVGGRVSGVTAFLCVAAAGVMLSLGVLLAPDHDVLPGVIAWLGQLAALAIAAVGTVLVTRSNTSRVLMRLVMAGAIIDVVMLAFSGQSLVA
jgi:4-hydroxybenzoate polyprenyltransferase